MLIVTHSIRKCALFTNLLFGHNWYTLGCQDAVYLYMKMVNSVYKLVYCISMSTPSTKYTNVRHFEI
jgi:hypothetical protein